MGYWDDHPMAGDTPLDVKGDLENKLTSLLPEPTTFDRWEEDPCETLLTEDSIRTLLILMDLGEWEAYENHNFVIPFLMVQFRITTQDEELSERLREMIGDGGAAYRGYPKNYHEGPEPYAKALYNAWPKLMSGELSMESFDNCRGLFEVMADTLIGVTNENPS